MSHKLSIRPVHTGSSPRYFGRLFFLVTVVMLGTGLCASALARTNQPIHTFTLLPGAVAKAYADGSLLFSTNPDRSPVLTGEVVPLIDTRRSRGHQETKPFTIVVAEGAQGGQRGFSTNRDDDQDGLIDEDPLDGLDNDGDGRTDEDYAAIGDAMVVVHQDGRQGGGRAAHLEYYHWAYPHLRSTVFMAAEGSPGLSNGGTYRLVLGDQEWRETTVISSRHSLAGKPETDRVNAFVAQVNRPESFGTANPASACNPSAQLWVGVVVLTETPGFRAVLDGGVLALNLSDTPLPVAVCLAESWSQLSRMLNEATRVHAGMADKLTGQRAPWIVPPLCAHCRLGSTPAFTWSRTAAGDLLVTAKIAAGNSGALDPDLFRLNGQPLGAPSEIRWQSAQGPVALVPWMCMGSAFLNRPHDRLANPYGEMPDLMDHRAEGSLRFKFVAASVSAPISTDQITGTYLDGRPMSAALRAVVPTAESDPVANDESALMGPHEALKVEVDQTDLLNSTEYRPTLSPKLLEGFPNPFRDTIQLRFQVPATVAEAFVWKKDKAPPAGLDKMAAVPWQSGAPQISVKIYSINGQELVTLFSGSQGPGESTVRWSGTDNFGRQVASGTYFCKLQMDDWSVTRRIVFLR